MAIPSTSQEAPAGHHDWFLTDAERGNDATRLPAWSEGNAVRPLVDGATYFAALADALEDAGAGDVALFADWRGDPDELLREGGPRIAEALTRAARRGVLVKGLIWRSPFDLVRFAPVRNRNMAQHVHGDCAEVVLDQRVRRAGSHHQKFFVLRHAESRRDDVAFIGSLDTGHSRRDDPDHRGDRQSMPFGRAYGPRPSWHDASVEVRGPAVADAEVVFRERWDDRAPLSLLPWQRLPDLWHRLTHQPSRLPPEVPAPPPAGTCAVQLLRTYPRRLPCYPFAPDGERSVARGHTKALRRARRLVYVEEQFLWSAEVARFFADALRASPELHLVVLVPRVPKRNNAAAAPFLVFGQARALEVLRAAGGDRLHVFDVENHEGDPVYVHSKITIVDDVWACVRSDNLSRRSWTHDSELSVAVLDEARDPRSPLDPAGLGDGARRFARDLRLQLMREHLDRGPDDCADLLDPDDAVAALHGSADALDAWHAGGRRGPRPPGRLRSHPPQTLPRWKEAVARPLYRAVLDPDGRPRALKRRAEF
ncbi:phosphatidylserine/phosphatidylglycerophosphate/cardiolipin synthase-like enzyme [Kineococcus xinjiangensis]|uniref:Phosphatidylserine/phosphatidylglycerophosphate/ cardiolipin synthase-like enzyme n=1 Tax=Kineococcus xinjiangensis TaxID=512762 RepID=A0A2S6IPT0_9ACTN|nr:phospholipase D family protein [Kineococcus xinjiangensis]PPK96140.1 phosphatidylserine/phosphatidylglycerophosphate/cardiolipin synthase-like enzyme [Kineococcus xinjiangensis]